MKGKVKEKAPVVSTIYQIVKRGEVGGIRHEVMRYEQVLIPSLSVYGYDLSLQEMKRIWREIKSISYPASHLIPHTFLPHTSVPHT